MVVFDARLFILDAGRVLELPLSETEQPQILLQPGEFVDGLPVLEPLDMTASSIGLHVLDRAGNIYRRGWESDEWIMERNDRPIGAASSHYYTALTAAADSRFLLETSYSYGIRYDSTFPESLAGWPLDEAYFVDLVAERQNNRSRVHVLQRQRATGEIELIYFEDGELSGRFKPRLEMVRPRALARWQDRLYLLDAGGRRLTALEAKTGLILDGYPLELPFPVSAVTTAADGQIVLAARDAVYFLRAMGEEHVVPDQTLALTGRWPHDPDVLASLPKFIFPIENLPISDRDLRLPGAPRHYRLGIHEGVDFYWGPGRQVAAAAAGTLTRVDFEYAVPGEAAFAGWRSLAAAQGFSTPEMLDFFRGRQVWIDHGNGVVTRYAHLSSVDPNLVVGEPVAAGEIIARVGNSGSPGALISDSEDSHLHFEIWIDDHYVGEFLRPIEIREVFERIFEEK